MKIIKTKSNKYMQAVDETKYDLLIEFLSAKNVIDSTVDELPKECKPTEKELNLIQYVDERLQEFEDNILSNYNTAATAVKCYKSWYYVDEDVIGYDIDSGVVRYTSIIFDVDIENSITAEFKIDLDNRKFYVELQQSGMALPECYNEYTDLDRAIDMLREYIKYPDEYSDYK